MPFGGLVELGRLGCTKKNDPCASICCLRLLMKLTLVSRNTSNARRWKLLLAVSTISDVLTVFMPREARLVRPYMNADLKT